MDARTETRRAIEAVIMVADEPADPRLLAQLVEVAPEVVEEICAELAAEYDESGRGFELVKVAGGWRFQSRADLSPYVERFVLSGQSSRLSAAALETLAIVAYKQPISRAQVSAIRGVSVDAVMRTLQQRGYIGELARDPGPGQAVLFGTTSLFLEKLGINGLDQLPSLGEFVPSVEVLETLEQTLMVDRDQDVVAETGESTEAPEGAESADGAGSAEGAEAVEPAESAEGAESGERIVVSGETVEPAESGERTVVSEYVEAVEAEPSVPEASETLTSDDMVIDLTDPPIGGDVAEPLEALEVLADDIPTY